MTVIQKRGLRLPREQNRTKESLSSREPLSALVLARHSLMDSYILLCLVREVVFLLEVRNFFFREYIKRNESDRSN